MNRRSRFKVSFGPEERVTPWTLAWTHGEGSRIRQLWVRLVITMLACAAFACAGSDVVVDTASGRPIEGVYVIATWAGATFQGVQSGHTCFKVEVTKTDAAGVFHLPTWSGNVNPLVFDRRRFFFFYKRGYREPNDPLQTDGPFPGKWNGPQANDYGAAVLQTLSRQCRAARTKSLSVVSNVRPWRMHSCAITASIVPICKPARRQRLRNSAASM